MIRVVLVDDQPLLRAGFRALIEAEDDIVVVGGAPDGRGALDVIVAQKPDVVLMDSGCKSSTDSRRHASSCRIPR